MATPILLDCDPGHDDAIALLLALASPEVELLGVTTVAGNQTPRQDRAGALQRAGGLRVVPLPRAPRRGRLAPHRPGAEREGPIGIDAEAFLDLLLERLARLG